MRFNPTNLRLLSALVAGAFTVSGCVTTAAVAPASVAAVAGLPEDKEAPLQTSDGLEMVSGSTRVTLRSAEGGANEVRLSSLRSEGGSLVLPGLGPGNGQTLALNNIWSAEITKPSPGKTAGLVTAIVIGTVILAVATFYVVGAVSLANSKF
jgi:hypothetical protein